MSTFNDVRKRGRSCKKQDLTPNVRFLRAMPSIQAGEAKMNRKAIVPCIVLAMLCSAACLRQQTGHTLYLSPEGAVTWTVLQRDIQSDADALPERTREEQEFLDRLASGRHPMLTALDSLNPVASRARFIRRERPYLVLTEARFERADNLMQRLLDELRVAGTATLTRDGDARTLTIVFQVPPDEPESPDESPIAPLLDSDESYRFMLTEGRFVAGDGFAIESGGSAAGLDEAWMDEHCTPGATVRVALTWNVSTPNSQRPTPKRTPNFQLPIPK
jgi:hypothetical protein